MSPINTDQLFQVLIELGLQCQPPHSEVIKNLSELNEELGLMLKGLPLELVVPDPKGERDLGFLLQPAISFQKKVLLLHDSEVLILGGNGGAGVLFVSNHHHGNVGLVWDPPENVFAMDFTDSKDRIVFWNENFLKWLQLFQKHGHDYLDGAGEGWE